MRIWTGPHSPYSRISRVRQPLYCLQTNNFKLNWTVFHGQIISCRDSVQVIKTAKREFRKIFEKTHCVQDSGAENNYVRVIVT